MRAIGYQHPGPISDPASLCDIELPRPMASGHDLLVRVRAISVNPVDVKIRASALPEAGQWKVLGWDAAGTVIEAGLQTTRFKTGDEVYYAGALGRSGTNAEYHLVDERIVGRKPASIDFPEAAALPLTSVTAWETLFDRLDVRRPVVGRGAGTARHRRRRRGRLDHDPACPGTDRPHRGWRPPRGRRPCAGWRRSERTM